MNNTLCFETFDSRCTFPEHVAPNDAIAGLGVSFASWTNSYLFLLTTGQIMISFVVLSALCLLGTTFACFRRARFLSCVQTLRTSLVHLY